MLSVNELDALENSLRDQKHLLHVKGTWLEALCDRSADTISELRCENAELVELLNKASSSIFLIAHGKLKSRIEAKLREYK